MMYRTRQGETLDLICHQHYGQASGYVELVLAANYRLSSQPEILPMGIEINLPDLPDQTQVQPGTMINLWD